jgi:hypothetical protein
MELDLAREQEEWSRRASGARAKAAQAYARLIDLAESRDYGQPSWRAPTTVRQRLVY